MRSAGTAQVTIAGSSASRGRYPNSPMSKIASFPDGTLISPSTRDCPGCTNMCADPTWLEGRRSARLVVGARLVGAALARLVVGAGFARLVRLVGVALARLVVGAGFARLVRLV